MIVTVYYSVLEYNPNTRICIMDETNRVVLFWFVFNHLIRKKPSKKIVKKLIEFGKVRGNRNLLYIDIDQRSTQRNTIYKMDYEIDYNT